MRWTVMLLVVVALGSWPRAALAQAAETSTSETPTSGDTDPLAPPLDAQLYGGIALSGAGAAFLVVAGIATGRIDQLENDPGYDDYRAQTVSGRDVCQQAEAGVVIPNAASPARVVEVCDEANAWEIVNYVAVPGGLALLGLGLYFVFTSDTAQIEPVVSLAPIVGPSQLGVTAAGRF
jgi:hypothetical protein